MHHWLRRKDAPASDHGKVFPQLYIYISMRRKNATDFVIARIRHLLPTTILMGLYYTLIFPYISYCNIVWGASYKSHLHNLFVLQKRVVRIICKLPYLPTSLPSFIKLKLLTIEQINRYQVLLFMHRLYHQRLPSSIPFDLQKVWTFTIIIQGHPTAIEVTVPV